MPNLPTDVAVVVLAAGQGTRFRSNTAKVLHRAAGRSLVRHVLEAVRPLEVARTVVVVGHQADAVRSEVEAAQMPGLATVLQHPQRGTGDALRQAMTAVDPDVTHVMVLPGDTPMLTAGALGQLLDAAVGTPAAMLTAEFADPTGYGRVLRSGDGSVERIVEQADASPAQLEVREGNAGMYVFERVAAEQALSRLDDRNAQGELYLTDVIGILRDGGAEVAGVRVPEQLVAGVNDRRQLAAAAAALRTRHLDELMVEIGVSVVDPATTYVDVDVEVGADTVLLPNTILDGGTRIGRSATIGPNSHLTACHVEDDASVHSTRAESAVIGRGASVGPFAHLRRGTRLGADTKAGSFVEVKNTEVGQGSKIPHLAYVGDATVGRDVNVACGVITVNYDGRDKHRTTLEDGAFVGCDTMLVAPVTVGAGGYTAAGSVITEDVPPGALGIARSRQTNKEGWSSRRP